MKRKSAIILSLMPVFLWTGCQTNTFTHKQFDERVAHIHTVGLASRVHTAILNRYSGNDPSPAPFTNEEQVRLELIQSTIAQLQLRGFVAMETSLPFLTNRIYRNAVQEVVSFAADRKVDGVLVLNVNAYKSTVHRQRITTPENIISFLLTAASIASLHPADFPYESWEGANVNVALVDGADGELLWSTWKDFDDFNKNKPSKDVEELFNQYPKSKSMKGANDEK